MKQIAAIFIGGGIAGALDITYAITVHFVTRGIKPIVILQSVASGVQGAEAYKGGVPSGLLGLGLHFFMTILMAIATISRPNCFRCLPRSRSLPVPHTV